jgi:hypothetical protein
MIPAQIKAKTDLSQVAKPLGRLTNKANEGDMIRLPS